MIKYDKIKDYFTNVDFDMVNDTSILDNVYNEISKYEQKLILDLDSVYNFEILIKKSSTSQLLKLCTKINLKDVFIKKTGSKFSEVLLTEIKYKLNNTLNKSNDKTELQEIVNLIRKVVDTNFQKIFLNKNGTHVLRKYFDLLDVPSLIHYKLLIYNELEKDLEIDALITTIYFLKLNFSKKIARYIIKNILNVDKCKNKIYTHIFEDIINLSDIKTLKIIFDKLKTDFNELVQDDYSVYCVLTLIKKYPQETDFFFNLCTKDMKNNNVLLRVLENYVKLKNYKKVDDIIFNIYDVSDVFKGFLLSNTDTPDTKYINLICLLMKQNKYNTNLDFIKYFNISWTHRKCGITLLRAFFEGKAITKLKKKMAFSIKGVSTKHADGKRIMELVKYYKKK